MLGHVRKFVQQGRARPPPPLPAAADCPLCPRVPHAFFSLLCLCAVVRVVSAYFTYEMETSTYVLDPLEKALFNTIILSITLGTAYLTYTYAKGA